MKETFLQCLSRVPILLHVYKMLKLYLLIQLNRRTAPIRTFVCVYVFVYLSTILYVHMFAFINVQ